MAVCQECGSDYADARAALGYDTCLVCGEAEAQVEVKRKAKCIAPLFNKGAYQYVGSFEAAKDAGRK